MRSKLKQFHKWQPSEINVRSYSSSSAKNDIESSRRSWERLAVQKVGLFMSSYLITTCINKKGEKEGRKLCSSSNLLMAALPRAKRPSRPLPLARL